MTYVTNVPCLLHMFQHCEQIIQKLKSADCTIQGSEPFRIVPTCTTIIGTFDEMNRRRNPRRVPTVMFANPPGPKSDGNPDSRIPEYIPGYIHISGSENLKIKVWKDIRTFPAYSNMTVVVLTVYCGIYNSELKTNNINSANFLIGPG